MTDKHKLSIRDKYYIEEAIRQAQHWQNILSHRVGMVIEARNLDPGEYAVDLQEGVIRRKEVSKSE